MIGDRLPARRRLPTQLVVLVAVSLSPVAACEAAKWRFSPRVAIEETWSDNIELAPPGAERSDFVTQLSPAIGATARGGRLTVDFDYQANMTRRARSDSGNSIDHQLQTTGTAELAKRLFFLDFSGVIGQRNSSNAATQSTDLVNVNSNRTRFATMSLSPYLRYRFGRTADGELRFRRQRVTNQGSTSTTLDSLSFDLSSGSEFSNLPWTLSAGVNRQDSSSGARSEFRNIDGSVQYFFSRKYSVRLNAGMESNDIQSDRSDTSSITWRASGIWTPTPRTSFELGYGSRFFGNSISMNLSHRMRKAVITAGYSEDTTTTAQQQAEQLLFPLQDAFGEPIENPGAAPVNIPTNTATLSDAVQVNRSFTLGLSLRGRLTDGSVNVFDTQRTFESGGTGDERVFGISGIASRTLSRRTNVSASGSWQRSERGGGQDDTLWSVRISASRTLRSNVTASMNYAYSVSSSADPGSEYTENRVNARVSVAF